MLKIVLQSFYKNALTSSSHKDTFPPVIAICQLINSQCERFQLMLLEGIIGGGGELMIFLDGSVPL